MKLADFDFELPARYIAQTPATPRDSAKLLRLDRASGALSHHRFHDIGDMLAPNDVLVLNNTRVIPARLRARKAETGGAVEILLLKRLNDLTWEALVGGRNVRAGMRLTIENSEISCRVVETLESSRRIVVFDRPIDGLLPDIGEMPLPPYIRERPVNDERYQTVYSAVDGSAAAPTAGLHFTPELLDRLTRKEVKLATCTLHIGLDTFQPVRALRVQDHRMHSEYARLDANNAEIINTAARAGGRIIAVGTTSARTLESAAVGTSSPDSAPPAQENGACQRRHVAEFSAQTRLFIYPGYRWRAVDAMITNFHLPRSTLLLMISAFAGRESILKTYETAKALDYRFYSFGDAMFIV